MSVRAQVQNQEVTREEFNSTRYALHVVTLDSSGGIASANEAPINTEYADGDTDATPNFGAIGFDNSSNTMRVASRTNPLPVFAPAVTGRIFDAVNSTTVTPTFRPFGVNSSGVSTLVSSVTGKKIRVIGLAVVSAGTVGVWLHDGTNNVIGDSTVQIQLLQSAGFVLQGDAEGWGETASGAPLQVTLSTNQGISGVLKYITVT